MRINSPKLNIMYKACMKAAKSLIRDFGEVENLQVSSKDLETLYLQLTQELKKL